MNEQNPPAPCPGCGATPKLVRGEWRTGSMSHRRDCPLKAGKRGYSPKPKQVVSKTSPIQIILDNIVLYASSGGVSHEIHCQLRKTDGGVCTCGALFLNNLVDGETIKLLDEKIPIKLAVEQHVKLVHVWRSGLVRLWKRRNEHYACLTKEGAAFLKDHNTIIGSP